MEGRKIMNNDGFHGFACHHTATERRNRIKISVAAYAYEIMNQPIMSDAEFDALALQINPLINTVYLPASNDQLVKRILLDQFFRTHYTPHSGMWVRLHPDLDGLANYYHKIYGNKKP